MNFIELTHVKRNTQGREIGTARVLVNPSLITAILDDTYGSARCLVCMVGNQSWYVTETLEEVERKTK